MAFSLMLTLPNGIVHAEDTLGVPQVVTEEQMNYELGPESPYAGQYITYGIDENGNYVRLSVTSIEARSVTATIAIYEAIQSVLNKRKRSIIRTFKVSQ